MARGRVVVLVAVGVGIVLAAAFLLRPKDQGWEDLPPLAFQEVTLQPETFTVNVHIPFEGEIAHTDAEVPFDEMAARLGELPEDRSTPIAVYCRSGRMSGEVMPLLAEAGYTELFQLDGGMVAWEKAGLTIAQRSS
jgi:phage shock protein E